jgi:hypothetical protein
MLGLDSIPDPYGPDVLQPVDELLELWLPKSVIFLILMEL